MKYYVNLHGDPTGSRASESILSCAARTPCRRTWHSHPGRTGARSVVGASSRAGLAGPASQAPPVHQPSQDRARAEPRATPNRAGPSGLSTGTRAH
jgi:hypothetical protein